MEISGGIIAGSTVVSGVVGADEDEDIPQVSTMGHFDVGWDWSVDRNESFEPDEYETNGTIPGYHTEENPSELVIFVHGWVKQDEVAPRFERQCAALRSVGVESPIISYTWDTDRGHWYVPIADSPWWAAAEVARRNGPKLANFLETYSRRSPATTIRIIGSSLGGRLVPAGIASLYDRNADVVVDSATLLGAAVRQDVMAIDGALGPGLVANAAAIDNFHKTNDSLLTVFRALELGKAVGKHGLPDDRQPAGYTDHQVDYVRSHGDYWTAEHGCIEEAVAAWDR